MKRLILAATAMLIAAGLDMTQQSPASAQDSEEEVRRPLISAPGAAITTARPEIGWVITQGGGRCTGTLISPDVVLTAAHCFDFLHHPLADGGANIGVSFARTADGTTYPASMRTPARAVYPFSDVLGLDDVAIVLLASSVTEVTPATIGVPPQRAASTSGYTIFGVSRGFPACSAPAAKRAVTVSSLALAAQATCRGDSGGPTVVGPVGGAGAIIGVTSADWGTENAIADPTPMRSDILRAMLAWSLNVNSDIGVTGECDGMAVYYGEVNGDDRPDAICFDPGTSITVALGIDAGGLRRNTRQPSAFCSHDTGQLHVGDFNGDGRTDLLCHDQRSGRKWIDYAQEASPYYAGVDYTLDTRFCSHDSGQLHVGDFNGDGRSDLLCHDTASGRKWVNYTAADGRLGNPATADWSRRMAWCFHEGARLFVGRFDEDAKSDMMCYTESSRTVTIAYNEIRGSDSPFGGQWQSNGRGDWDGAAPNHDDLAPPCSGPNQRLQVGSFTRSGTSQIACLDTTPGRFRFDWRATHANTRNDPIRSPAGQSGGGTLRVMAVDVAAAPWPFPHD